MMRWSKMSYPQKKAWAGRMFVLPWLIGFIFIFMKSLLQSFIYSISKISVTKGGFQTAFIGFENYRYALTGDPDFVRTLVRAVQSMLIQVPMVIIFSLIIACILNQKFRGRLLARAIFFLPVIVATGLVISIMRGDIFSRALSSGERMSTMFTVASLLDMLVSIGFSTEMANQLILFINSIFDVSWKSGIQILLFVAGLQTVPRQLYEVAQMEGSTAWDTFWKITFPMLTPILMLNIIYTIIDNFTDYSNPVMRMCIDTATKSMRYEFSATIAWIYFIIIFAAVGLVSLFLKKRIFYIVD